MDVHGVAGGGTEGGRNVPAVDDEGADLRERHTQRLDHMPQRPCPVVGHPHLLVTMAQPSRMMSAAQPNWRDRPEQTPAIILSSRVRRNVDEGFSFMCSIMPIARSG